MNMPPAPWIEHRQLAEQLAQAIMDALALETGSKLQLGNAASFEPTEMLGGKPAPIRAYLIWVNKPLRDVIVVFSSLGQEHVEPLLAPAARAVMASLGIEGEEEDLFAIDPPVQYDTVEQAVDQADPLFLEGSYELSMPLGDLRIVFGTGLLESATCHVSGMPDPWAEGAPAPEVIPGLEAPAASEDAAADAAVDADAPAAAEGEGDSGIDALDRELAEQEAAAAAALADDLARAGIPDFNSIVAAASEAQAGVMRDTARWASLLSGVEVELSAELGRTHLELGDITTLVADRVLTLDQMVEEPVTVYVNGTAFATARMVIVDGEYGIEILEVLEQVDPAAVGLLPQQQGATAAA